MSAGKFVAGILIVSLFFIYASTVNSQATRGAVTLSVKKAGDGAGVIASSPPGIECGEGPTECSASFAVGTSVTLTPKDIAAGSTFNRWSYSTGSTSQCEGTKGPCTFVISADSSLTAFFQTASSETAAVEVVIKGNDSGVIRSVPEGIACGGGNLDCKAYFPADTDVILTFDPGNSPLSLTEWSNGTGSAITCNKGIQECKFKVDRDSSITAVVESK